MFDYGALRTLVASVTGNLGSNTVVAQADHPLYLIFLGAPGAGKGTQTALLSQNLGILRISSGDLFRENIKNQTELGRAAKSYIDRGELVPDRVTVEMVMERIRRPDCRRGALFDGFPRTIPQAEALDAALAREGKAIRAVIDLVVDHDILLERLGGRWMCRGCGASYHLSFHPPAVAGCCDTCQGELYQRDDDSAATIEHRLLVYYRQTAPLQEFYRERSLLKTVDGQQEIEIVQEAVLTAIGMAQLNEV